MKKNNIGIILIISVLISFISGALGSIIIYKNSINLLLFLLNIRYFFKLHIIM